MTLNYSINYWSELFGENLESKNHADEKVK